MSAAPGPDTSPAWLYRTTPYPWSFRPPTALLNRPDLLVVRARVADINRKRLIRVDLMFGDAQMTALADVIQAALMLKYNKRTVG